MFLSNVIVVLYPYNSDLAFVTKVKKVNLDFATLEGGIAFICVKLTLRLRRIRKTTSENNENTET